MNCTKCFQQWNINQAVYSTDTEICHCQYLCTVGTVITVLTVQCNAAQGMHFSVMQHCTDILVQCSTGNALQCSTKNAVLSSCVLHSLQSTQWVLQGPQTIFTNVSGPILLIDNTSNFYRCQWSRQIVIAAVHARIDNESYKGSNQVTLESTIKCMK